MTSLKLDPTKVFVGITSFIQNIPEAHLSEMNDTTYTSNFLVSEEIGLRGTRKTLPFQVQLATNTRTPYLRVLGDIVRTPYVDAPKDL